MADRKPPLVVENLDQATFKCTFPACAGICCKNSRPPVEPDEQVNIDGHLDKFLPHLRSSARAHVEKNGWRTRRVKEGFPTIAVEGGWCVFANGGCTLQKVGMAEAAPWRYKPAACIRFPVKKTKGGSWYIRQWGYRGEDWDLFCLNPEESKVPARQSLVGEIRFSAEREQKLKKERT
jgi:hypothetical protein